MGPYSSPRHLFKKTVCSSEASSKSSKQMPQPSLAQKVCGSVEWILLFLHVVYIMMQVDNEWTWISQSGAIRGGAPRAKMRGAIGCVIHDISTITRRCVDKYLKTCTTSLEGDQDAPSQVKPVN